MFKMSKKNKIIIISVVIIALASLSYFLFWYFSTRGSARESAEITDPYKIPRDNMVNNQIIARGVKDREVLDSMSVVPRQDFVDESLKDSAYIDRPLPIGMGQTISQPYIVALMTESLELSGNEKVLEIGTGSGYQAAILAYIVNEIYTVEIVPTLYENSKVPLADYPNVIQSNHDGYYGWEEHAPFDRIIVTCAPDHIPQPLVDQLADGGIMVIPVGPPGWNQVLWKVIKQGDDVITEKILDVIFVPLTRGFE